MPRTAGPWFRSCKNAWYITLDGKKVSLGVSGKQNKKAAIQAWHQLLANGPEHDQKPTPKQEPKPTPEANKEATVKQVIDGFIADAAQRACVGTVRNYRLFLLPFAKLYGSHSAETLTVADAEAYARQPKWSSTYRANFLAALMTAYRWAVRGQLIARCPLQGLRKPPRASRGAKALVSAEDHAQLVAHADPMFGAFLQLLWLTGARPGEIAALRAQAVDNDQGVAILENHKCAHLGKSRVLFLCPEALAVLRRLDVNQGLFFPGEDGQRLTAQAIGRRLARLCVKAGVRSCMAYGYRHTFATDALAHGVPDAQVAGLLGHSGTAMLHRHYSHLTSRSQVLREALGRIR